MAKKNKIDKIPDNLDVKYIGNHLKIVCKDANKIIFASKSDAKYEINRIKGLEQKNKKPNRAYECHFCNGWHITSSPNNKWEAKQR